MLALSIRQPFAELILRGIKTAEYRSRATRIIGEPFYIYASKRPADRKVWSSDLAVPGGDERGRIAWLVELAEQARLIDPGLLLPTGVIVGTAVIERCVEISDQTPEVESQGSHVIGQKSARISQPRRRRSMFAWHLRDVARVEHPRKPRRMPQPVWFSPF